MPRGRARFVGPPRAPDFVAISAKMDPGRMPKCFDLGCGGRLAAASIWREARRG